MNIKQSIAWVFVFGSISAFASSTSTLSSAQASKKSFSSSASESIPMITNEAEYAKFQKQKEQANHASSSVKSKATSPKECIAGLFKYGDEISPDKLGQKVELEITQEPNLSSEKDKLTPVSTYRSGESWLSEIDCALCESRKIRTGVYLVPSKPLPCGLKKGITIPEITKILGEPGAKQDDEYLFFYRSEVQSDYIGIHLVDGKLKALQLIYYQY